MLKRPSGSARFGRQTLLFCCLRQLLGPFFLSQWNNRRDVAIKSYMKDRKLSSARAETDPTKIDPKKAYEEHCLQELRLAGFRITMPRIQVIRALADATTALSAYAIHERIMESGGRIDVVSVYRILATLHKVGLIHHIG